MNHQPNTPASLNEDDETVAALLDALEPRPVAWEGRWVCKVRNQRGLGIGNTPVEAHEDFFNSLTMGKK